ncbi:prepilin peptidase [Herbiconiux sp. VKM Ac-1786]|uniref:prepilin peptidase n=1 Tax=Herbiconiux sp. VKM Ac-1786 TaxID=2783824 RepID=UPI00188A4CD4|nr:prepilin peptidase [Herbiconiux sp. VKM Ac-1786]MBF4574030.1 prepilin peptidase [Herbiconiux sp. VKM Ac-1786]
MQFVVVSVPFLHLALVSVPLAVTDARTGRLPNAHLVPGLVLLAWALAAVGLHDPPSAFGAAAAALAVGAVAVGLWAVGVLGMGDVKLVLLLAGLLALVQDVDGGAAVRVAFCVCALVLASLLSATMGGGGAGGGGAGGGGAGGGGCGRGGGDGRLDGEKGRIPVGPALLGGFWLGLLPSLALFAA